MRGFPSNENVKQGYPLKRYFAVIGSFGVKTVADRYSMSVPICNRHNCLS